MHHTNSSNYTRPRSQGALAGWGLFLMIWQVLDGSVMWLSVLVLNFLMCTFGHHFFWGEGVLIWFLLFFGPGMGASAAKSCHQSVSRPSSLSTAFLTWLHNDMYALADFASVFASAFSFSLV